MITTTLHNDKLYIIAKLYLEPGSVEIQYFLTGERGVSREEQLVLASGHNPDDETHFALQ